MEAGNCTILVRSATVVASRMRDGRLGMTEQGLGVGLRLAKPTPFERRLKVCWEFGRLAF
jgi:hypothetical protein